MTKTRSERIQALSNSTKVVEVIEDVEKQLDKTFPERLDYDASHLPRHVITAVCKHFVDHGYTVYHNLGAQWDPCNLIQIS